MRKLGHNTWYLFNSVYPRTQKTGREIPPSFWKIGGIFKKKGGLVERVAWSYTKCATFTYQRTISGRFFSVSQLFVTWDSWVWLRGIVRHSIIVLTRLWSSSYWGHCCRCFTGRCAEIIGNSPLLSVTHVC